MGTLTQNRVFSLNTDVYERLKAMISEQKIEPGTRLVQQSLAKQFGTSAMPIVEAIRRLERDGLVSHVPHLGSFVREPTLEDLGGLYGIRRGLESEACRLFVQCATARERDRLSELNRQMNEAARNGDLDGCLEADFGFHTHIIAGARAPRISEILENRRIEEKMFQYASPGLRFGDGTARLVGIHDAIVAAILAGDEAAATEAMRQHLLEAEQFYRQAIEAKKQ